MEQMTLEQTEAGTSDALKLLPTIQSSSCPEQNAGAKSDDEVTSIPAIQSSGCPEEDITGEITGDELNLTVAHSSSRADCPIDRIGNGIDVELNSMTTGKLSCSMEDQADNGNDVELNPMPTEKLVCHRECQTEGGTDVELNNLPVGKSLGYRKDQIEKHTDGELTHNAVVQSTSGGTTDQNDKRVDQELMPKSEEAALSCPSDHIETETDGEFNKVLKQPVKCKECEWMPMPVERPLGCPPGLEYLTKIDQILIHQQVEILEAVTSLETQNRYVIKNSLGQQIFFAKEESGCCWRYWCQQKRPFIMHVNDNQGQEVIRVIRPFQGLGFSGCCWCAGNQNCCSLKIRIESPPGTLVGYASQTCSAWRPQYDIMDALGDCVLKIRGPCWLCNTIICRCDIEFSIMSADLTTEIGAIHKQWAGIAKEWFTNADIFGMNFPQDLDVKMKAVLIGALFLIDFVFYEEKN